jgi:hypothetical protein
MIINNVAEIKIVEEYDILLSNGILVPLTIDKQAGDTVEYEHDPVAVKFNIAAKQSESNPDVKTPEEEITIFMAHVLTINKRKREVTQLSPEQKEQWKSFQKISDYKM